MTNANGGSNLGGGPFDGFSPKQTITNYKDSNQTMMRRELRDAWNTAYAAGTVNNKKRITTPFRAVSNSGDFLSRTNYVCGGPNPNHMSRGGISLRFGSMISNCDNTGVPASSCNVKFVADSSDYTKFKRQQAYNRNYNDLGYGGSTNSSYVDLMRVRSF
jgi:hypothetical protein